MNDDNILVWDALIHGPDGTPYSEGVFLARLNFPSDYPLNPPTMRFLSPIYHPNGTRLAPNAGLTTPLQCTRTAVCASASSTSPATTR